MTHSQDTCLSEKISTALATSAAREAVTKLYITHGSATEIEEDLWQMLMCCMASEELNTFTAINRANFMQLHREIVTLLKTLLPKEERPLN